MSTTDLSILADAVTFAILVAIGGAIAYAVARAAWKRHSMHQTAKWACPRTRAGGRRLRRRGAMANCPRYRAAAADIAGFEISNSTPRTTIHLPSPNPDLHASPPTGARPRLRSCSIPDPGGLDISPPPGTNSSSSPTDGPAGPTRTRIRRNPDPTTRRLRPHRRRALRRRPHPPPTRHRHRPPTTTDPPPTTPTTTTDRHRQHRRPPRSRLLRRTHRRPPGSASAAAL